jgi:hypothetical protein
MTGAEREQCLKDEGAKNDTKAQPQSATGGTTSPSSTTAAPEAGTKESSEGQQTTK